MVLALWERFTLLWAGVTLPTGVPTRQSQPHSQGPEAQGGTGRDPWTDKRPAGRLQAGSNRAVKGEHGAATGQGV